MVSTYMCEISSFTTYCKQSNFCAVVFLVVGGGILYFHGNLIIMVNKESAVITGTLPGKLIVAEFAGCLTAVSFIVSNGPSVTA